MPRTLRDARLDTREARARLKARGKPHWRLIEPGLHLGYRRLSGKPGTWCVRRYVGNQRYAIEALPGVIADDYADADGKTVLDFKQAQRAVLARKSKTGAGRGGLYTVADAMDAYFGWLESEGRSDDAIRDARYRDQAFIRPKLGALEVSSLTADRLRTWRDGLAKAAPRLRTRAGERQQHRDGADARSRRASANRIWTTLRAALNHAFAGDKVESDKAWRKVKPFKGVDKARVRFLSVAEAKRLVNASDPDFRSLLLAALLTGGRYGQIAALTVADFNPDAGTVRMATRKGDGSEKVYHVHLNAESIRFFETACAGHAGADLIFTKGDGSAWGKSHQKRPIEEASARAKISPPANFHVTRHTWASHAVMNGVPLLVVAKSLGHSDTRMVEKVYSHLAPSFIADAIRAGAPRYGFKPGQKVIALPVRP